MVCSYKHVIKVFSMLFEQQRLPNTNDTTSGKDKKGGSKPEIGNSNKYDYIFQEGKLGLAFSSSVGGKGVEISKIDDNSQIGKSKDAAIGDKIYSINKKVVVDWTKSLIMQELKNSKRPMVVAFEKKQTIAEKKKINMDNAKDEKAAATAGNIIAKYTPIDAEDAKIRKLWDKMDADQSGTLNHAELKEGFKMLGKDLSKDQVTTLQAGLDKDKSGSVNYLEFKAFFQRQIGSGKKKTKDDAKADEPRTGVQTNENTDNTVPNLIEIHVTKGSLGIQLNKIPGRKTSLLIKKIDPNGPLKDKKNLKLGYVLYSVNDEQCYEKTSMECMRQLKSAGRPIKLKFCPLKSLPTTPRK